MERKLFYKNNLKKSSIPSLYSKLLTMDTKDLIDILFKDKNFSERLKLLYFIHKMSNKLEHVKEYSNM